MQSFIIFQMEIIMQLQINYETINETFVTLSHDVCDKKIDHE